MASVKLRQLTAMTCPSNVKQRPIVTKVKHSAVLDGFRLRGTGDWDMCRSLTRPCRIFQSYEDSSSTASHGEGSQKGGRGGECAEGRRRVGEVVEEESTDQERSS